MTRFPCILLVVAALAAAALGHYDIAATALVAVASLYYLEA